MWKPCSRLAKCLIRRRSLPPTVNSRKSRSCSGNWSAAKSASGKSPSKSAGLNEHKSAHLLKRYERAQKAGRDLLAEIVVEIRNELGRRTAERDHLKDQVEHFDHRSFAQDDERVAQAIFTLGLELGLDDDDTSPDTGWHSFDVEDD